MKLQDLCSNLQIDLQEEFSKEITGLNTLQDATKSEISFLQNSKYKNQLSQTKAAAVFVTQQESVLVPEGTLALVCENPYVALAYASKFFAPKVIELQGNDPIIGEGSIIQNNVYLGKKSSIGKNAVIMNGSFIGDNVSIGNNCIIYPNVSIYRDCIIGNDTIIHSGAVIGSDGFGFATDKNGCHIKIYQNGNVIVGNSVEIGANTAIDRAAFSSTIIEDFVRIDNLVHIAHNCKIGYGSIITGQCGFAGSTEIGKYCVFGAQSGVAGHLQLAPFTTIAAKSGVTKSITESHKQWAGFPLNEHKVWLKLQAKIQKLLKG